MSFGVPPDPFRGGHYGQGNKRGKPGERPGGNFKEPKQKASAKSSDSARTARGGIGGGRNR